MDLKPEDKEKFDSFVEKNYYLTGTYDKKENFKELNNKIFEITKLSMSPDEKGFNFTNCNRFFYLALPPSAYSSALEMISLTCKATVANNFTRVVIEKPFGKDSESSYKLSVHLSKLFTEEEIYRIDHYLGKEMVQNLIILRFSNIFFNRIWNRDSIECVMITFKETVGIDGRKYFDEYGIIRLAYLSNN